jgi:tripartite-type tricarboxylate transporter receptor subunit TctC
MENHSSSKRFLLAALALATLSQIAHAAYPEKPIRWIVPSAAGGTSDSTVRIVAAHMTRTLGQPIVVENKPGAAGIIGLDAIAKAPADGYTIGTAALSNIVTGTLVARSVPFNPVKDFAPIAMLSTAPNLLGVNASLPVKTVDELVAYSKKHPNALFYGSNGNGSSLHVAMEQFKSATGLDATHVPYKSTPAAENDLMGGQIHVMFDNFSTMAPNVISGRVRALAITGKTRSPQFPNLPTIAEAGVPGAEMVAWNGVIGPANMPKEAIEKLNAAINAALRYPKLAKQINDFGSDPIPMTETQFGQFLQAENQKWGAVIKKHNIVAD